MEIRLFLNCSKIKIRLREKETKVPYVNNPSSPLDWLMAPLKAIGAPWGAAQTAIAGGDPWEALRDPDHAIRGRQLSLLPWLAAGGMGAGAVGAGAGAYANQQQNNG